MSSAPAILYCTPTDLDGLMSQSGHVGTLDDYNEGALDDVETAYETNAIEWATDRVNLFLLSRYADVDLAKSPLVKNWTVICAAKWLSSRRGNPPPDSIDELYREALEDMKLIKAGEYQLPRVGPRHTAFPAWSNVRTDVFYRLRKNRVERPISDHHARNGFIANRDIVADQTVEPN